MLIFKRLPISFPGEWTSAIYYRASNESINESSISGGEFNRSLLDICTFEYLHRAPKIVA